MRELFDDMVAAIKSHLPKAMISWDISAWIGESGFRAWYISVFNNNKKALILIKHSFDILGGVTSKRLI